MQQQRIPDLSAVLWRLRPRARLRWRRERCCWSRGVPTSAAADGRPAGSPLGAGGRVGRRRGEVTSHLFLRLVLLGCPVSRLQNLIRPDSSLPQSVPLSLRPGLCTGWTGNLIPSSSSQNGAVYV